VGAKRSGRTGVGELFAEVSRGRMASGGGGRFCQPAMGVTSLPSFPSCPGRRSSNGPGMRAFDGTIEGWAPHAQAGALPPRPRDLAPTARAWLRAARGQSPRQPSRTLRSSEGPASSASRPPNGLGATSQPLNLIICYMRDGAAAADPFPATSSPRVCAACRSHPGARPHGVHRPPAASPDFPPRTPCTFSACRRCGPSEAATPLGGRA